MLLESDPKECGNTDSARSRPGEGVWFWAGAQSSQSFWCAEKFNNTHENIGVIFSPSFSKCLPIHCKSLIFKLVSPTGIEPV